MNWFDPWSFMIFTKKHLCDALMPVWGSLVEAAMVKSFTDFLDFPISRFVRLEPLYLHWAGTRILT